VQSSLNKVDIGDKTKDIKEYWNLSYVFYGYIRFLEIWVFFVELSVEKKKEGGFFFCVGFFYKQERRSNW
jgi:hypothetical protein